MKYCGSNSHFDARLSQQARRASGRMATAVLRVGAGRRDGTGPRPPGNEGPPRMPLPHAKPPRMGRRGTAGGPVSGGPGITRARGDAVRRRSPDARYAE